MLGTIIVPAEVDEYIKSVAVSDGIILVKFTAVIPPANESSFLSCGLIVTFPLSTLIAVTLVQVPFHCPGYIDIVALLPWNVTF